VLGRTLKRITLIAAVVAGAIGCKPKDPLDGMKFRDTFGRKQEVITDPNGQPPVAVGKPTLAYMLDFACVVRVTDVETKKELASHDAKAGDIVVIDAANGIKVGDDRVKPGPLNADDRYGIFLDRR
jgi:hypothetical protein